MNAPLRRATELPVYKRLPLTIVEGDGVHVTDADGRTFLDLYGGHATAILGYRHPAILDALATQAHDLFFQTNLVDVPIRAVAAEALGALFPDALNRVFFVNSGAEANENALRLAVRATGRNTIVALEGAFHGRTSAAGACTWGHERWYGFAREPIDVRFVPYDDPEAVGAAIDSDVAAVIVEPVQGVGGARRVPNEVLVAARAACDAAGALLISDEVQCGLGRTGHFCAMQVADVVPDLVTVGKGVAGGFPCSALLCTEAVGATAGPGDLGTTFGGGPLACALVATVCQLLVDEDRAAHATALFAHIEQSCHVGPVVDIQGAGLLVGLRTSVPAAEVVTGLREKGILVGTSADPHVFRLMPPLTLTEAHIDTLAAALEAL